MNAGTMGRPYELTITKLNSNCLTIDGLAKG